MRNEWQHFLAQGEDQLAKPTLSPASVGREAPAHETAVVISQGTLRSLLLLAEGEITRDEARRCAQQVAQLRRSLGQAENAFRRRAGEPL